MKKTPYLILLILVVAFVTAQSFHSLSPLKETTNTRYFKSYPTGAAMCTPLYLNEDPAIDITALKGWGNFKWKISSASDSVQYYFNQGISLYYAFHSIEAIASFTKATHLDPSCAMAWYGKALAMGPTINYPNGYLAPTGALEAALKSKQLAANCSPLEKDLIEAIQHRYSADTTIAVKQLRINYADAMQKVYSEHKNNADAATLYADALLLVHPWDLYDHDSKAKPWTPEIRKVLESAIAIAPKHPGANHYYIHTMEASAHPELALKSAHLLDTLMPQVSHITHMPSHIYIRTGDYLRGIKVNNVALAGYNSYLKTYAPVVNNEGIYELHNVHLKGNCAQMAGNYATAAAAGKTVQKELIDGGYLVLKGADGNYMQYIYSTPLLAAVRFGKWEEILNTPLIDTMNYASLLQHFARGVAYGRKHDLSHAQEELKRLTLKMKDESLKLNPDNFSRAYDAALIAQNLLQGVISEEQKQYNQAVIYYQKAVSAEDNLIYNEPRDWPIPARQYLGNALIKAGKNGKAITIFNKDLTINPNNGWSLTGLELAYQNTGNMIASKQVKARLKDSWKIKDVKIDSPVF